MSIGFPIHFLPKLRCTTDGAALELGPGCCFSEDGGFVRYGYLRCCDCSTEFVIEHGILNLLNGVRLDDESIHEQQLRDRSAKDATISTSWDEYHLMEMLPTLEALSIGPESTVLELGCGDGRYTVDLAARCGSLLAVDFSMDSLRLLQARLKDARNVALVFGDATTIKVSVATFDRVFSTLMSNLPTREHRDALYRLARSALLPNGRFVFSTHHHGFRQMLHGVVKSGRYEDGGIYRYNFTAGECRAEVRPYFEVVKARPIQIYFPLVRLPQQSLLTWSRILERVPLVRDLGNLLLCTAERPVAY